jgi:hypothetical protein
MRLRGRRLTIFIYFYHCRLGKSALKRSGRPSDDGTKVQSNKYNFRFTYIQKILRPLRAAVY